MFRPFHWRIAAVHAFDDLTASPISEPPVIGYRCQPPEERMRYSKFGSAAAICLGLVITASAASAAEATQATCRDLDSQVRAALETTQQSANQQEAVKERDSGRAYCMHGYYRLGADHLSQALKLLGQKT